MYEQNSSTVDLNCFQHFQHLSLQLLKSSGLNEEEIASLNDKWNVCSNHDAKRKNNSSTDGASTAATSSTSSITIKVENEIIFDDIGEGLDTSKLFFSQKVNTMLIEGSEAVLQQYNS